MTTKTMDGEEYLANLESADEQNYKRLFGEEYIKKSDVKTIISRIENINIAVDSWEQIEELPTINFSGIIDEMIAQEEHIEHNSFNERERTFGQYAKIRLQELRDILYIKSGDFQKDLDKITF